eukprot:1159176-Pelagomonas_calceolata.AAC.2
MVSSVSSRAAFAVICVPKSLDWHDTDATHSVANRDDKKTNFFRDGAGGFPSLSSSKSNKSLQEDAGSL